MTTPNSALYRYFQWDGKQRQRLGADDLMSALSDDFLYSGNIQQALKSMLRRGGMMPGGQRLSGIHDMIRKLRQQRRQQLERYNLDSLFDGLKEQLQRILDKERKTVQDWLQDSARTQRGDQDDSEQSSGQEQGGERGGPKDQRRGDRGDDRGDDDRGDNSGAGSEGGNDGAASDQTEGPTGGSNQRGSAGQGPQGSFSDKVLKNIAARNQSQLDQLPQDMSGQIKSLQDYEFLNTEAQKEFDDLMQQLRDAMTQTFFKDVSDMVNSMSEGDLKRMKDMLKALNDMLVKKIAGEDPGFEQFMDQFGDMFGDNPPESLDQLLAQMEAQMAAAQSLMNSLSADQRSQLQALMDGKFGDPELQQELMKLSKELSFLNPQSGQFNFSGEEAIDFQSAMQLMEEMQQLERLEKDFQGVRDLEDLGAIDEDLIKELLGEEGLDDFKELKDLAETLEKAGYIRKDGDKWTMTPRGSRVIGQKALEEIYNKLKHARLGNHRSTKEGLFGDQQEDSKTYEFGDPLHLHIPRTLKNAICRESASGAMPPLSKRGGGRRGIKLAEDDFEVHRHELNTKTSTVLLLDLSLSMALRDAFLPAKKVALALHSLISSRYPRDSMAIIGFSAYAHEIKPQDLISVDVDQFSMGTNMQHALILAEKKLAREHGGTKQIIMISDGEPTAHLEDGYPYFEYPPNPRTIAKTLLAVKRCTQKNITINTFMLERSPFLRSFMDKVAQMNGGRVFYTTPHNLGEYILHDFVANRRKRVA